MIKEVKILNRMPLNYNEHLRLEDVINDLNVDYPCLLHL
jgi:hypothetical protein